MDKKYIHSIRRSFSLIIATITLIQTNLSYAVQGSPPEKISPKNYNVTQLSPKTFEAARKSAIGSEFSFTIDGQDVIYKFQGFYNLNTGVRCNQPVAPCVPFWDFPRLQSDSAQGSASQEAGNGLSAGGTTARPSTESGAKPSAGELVVGRIAGAGLGAFVSTGLSYGLRNSLSGDALANATLDLEKSKDRLRIAEHGYQKAVDQGNIQTREFADTLSSFNSLKPASPAPQANFIAQELDLDKIDKATLQFGSLYRARVRTAAEKINNAPTVRGEYELIAKQIAKQSLETSLESQLKGWLDLSESQLRIAEVMVDILYGLDPFTGTHRGLYEFFTGKNLFNHRPLSNFERGLSGAMGVLSVVTLGIVPGTVRAAKALGMLIRAEGFAATESVRVMEGLAATGLRSKMEVQKFAEMGKNWSEIAWQKLPEVQNQLRLSPSDLANEAARLQTPEQVLAGRRTTAIGFYNGVEKFTGKSEIIGEHLHGIDFAHPVEVVTLPKGTVVTSWQIPEEAVGSYVTIGGAKPPSLGMESIGKGADGRLYAKIPRNYVLTEDVQTLKSKASGVIDTWSWEAGAKERVPDLFDPSKVIETKGHFNPGGADQFVLSKNTFVELGTP